MAATKNDADLSTQEILDAIRRYVIDDAKLTPTVDKKITHVDTTPVELYEDEEVIALTPAMMTTGPATAAPQPALPPRLSTKPAAAALASSAVLPGTPPTIASRAPTPQPTQAPAPPALPVQPSVAMPPPPRSPGIAATLLSQQTTSAAAQSFARLYETAKPSSLAPERPEQQSQQPAPAKTLEQTVLELLRPLLKTWLDQHLPPLVAALVAREIETIKQQTPPPESPPQ